MTRRDSTPHNIKQLFNMFRPSFAIPSSPFPDKLSYCLPCLKAASLVTWSPRLRRTEPGDSHRPCPPPRPPSKWRRTSTNTVKFAGRIPCPGRQAVHSGNRARPRSLLRGVQLPMREDPQAPARLCRERTWQRETGRRDPLGSGRAFSAVALRVRVECKNGTSARDQSSASVA